MSDPIDLQGAKALVTGASTGAGFATAMRLIEEGAKVVATVRKESDAGQLRDAGASVEILDLTNHAAARAMVERNGPLDVLVNNAAYSYRAAFEHGDLEEIRAMFEVNFFALVSLAQAAIPAMRGRHSGAIVNVTSVSGRVAQHLNGYYPATKFAVEAISEQMYYELRPFNIRVVIIEPGGIKSNFLPNMHLEPRTYDDPDTPYAKLVAQLRPGEPRGSDPSVIADAIVRSLVEPAPGKLRWPATPDAVEQLTVRDQMNDEQFAEWLIKRANLEWW